MGDLLPVAQLPPRDRFAAGIILRGHVEKFMLKLILGAAATLGLLASRGLAQQPNTSDTTTQSSTPATTKTMSMHSTKSHTVSVSKTMTHRHRHMTHAQAMKWCKSMSHKKMMRYKSCRVMMAHHHDMKSTHHATAASKKTS